MKTNARLYEASTVGGILWPGHDVDLGDLDCLPTVGDTLAIPPKTYRITNRVFTHDPATATTVCLLVGKDPLLVR